MTLLMRGHDVGQRVKMNDATQTRPARSASVTVRPDRSVRRNAPSRKGCAARSCPAGPGVTRIVTVPRHTANASAKVPRTKKRPLRYEANTRFDHSGVGAAH